MFGQPVEVEAVSGVSFEVRAGDSLGVVGESGSGKTTIARMIVGLERPSAGEIHLDGNPVSASHARRERLRLSRFIQMVFQDPYTSLDPRQSPRAAVEEVQRVHFQRTKAERETRTSELFDAVGLGAREMRALPRELSGGQRQRVAIARALAAEPRVLVLDEALSGLDVSVQAQILNLLGDLRDQYGLTYVLISHDLAVVRQICDRVIVMYRGVVMESGPVEELLSGPAHPYTQRLLRSVPQPGMLLRARTASVGDLADGCRFRSRCPKAEDDPCAITPPTRTVGPDHSARCWKLAPRPSGDPDTEPAHQPESPSRVTRPTGAPATEA
jgi:peptide/nickel transport system ATP-binding protein